MIEPLTRFRISSRHFVMPQKIFEGLFSHSNTSQGPGDEKVHKHCDYECQHKTNIYRVSEQNLPIYLASKCHWKYLNRDSLLACLLLAACYLLFNAYIFHLLCVLLCFIFHCFYRNLFSQQLQRASATGIINLLICLVKGKVT